MTASRSVAAAPAAATDRSATSAGTLQEAQAAGPAQPKRGKRSLADNGPVLRRLAWPFLRLMPTVAVGNLVIVTRHADVVEVLTRDEDFTVAEVNAVPMDRVNGPFVLGMDRSEQCLRERSILQRCVHDGDTERIRSFVAAIAASLVERARPAGRIDVVQDLARPAAARLVAAYFGVAGPDEATLQRWMRTLFHEAFLNGGGAPEVRRAAEVSAAELHAFTDELIATRQAQIRAGERTPDDFLTRLVRLQGDEATRLSDEGVRRNVGGVIVGAVETTSKAVAHATEQLLRHRDAFQKAQAAARAGDVETVRGYAFDALRFNPINPVLARYAARPAVLGAGTRRERRIPEGRKVFAAVLPAMFDPRAFPSPGQLRADRPASSYLHFGHGLHACFGRYVNQVQIPELVAALLRLDGLRPADGDDGVMLYDGPFPDRYLLAFEASGTTAASGGGAHGAGA